MPKPGNPFVVPGMDPELAELINVHRGLFGGFTMTAPPAEPPAQPPAEPAATQQPPEVPAAPQEPAQPAWDGKVESLPQGVQDLIKNLRSENAQKRTAAKTAEDDANAKIAAALKALGIDTADEDPVKVAEQAKAERDAQQNAARNAQLQLSIYKLAAKTGADPDALLDSNSFLASLNGLDPADVKAVEAAIKTAIDNNPKLKSAPAAGKSGPELNGGTGGQGSATSEIEAAKKAGDIAKAISLTNAQLFKE